MTAAYPERLSSLLEDLSAIEDRDLRADLLIEYAGKFIPVPPTIATRPYPEDHKVPACESDAYGWVIPSNDGTLKIHFAVENPQGISAKALAAILDETLSGTTPDQVLLVDEGMIDEIFGKAVSMGKGMGLRGMIRLVKRYAEELRSQSSSSDH